MTALEAAAYVAGAYVVVVATFLCFMIIRLILKNRAAYRRKGANK